MTSGLGFDQVDLFQSNPKVKGSCFPIYPLNLSIHQLFICHPILLSAPSLPPLRPSRHSSLSFSFCLFLSFKIPFHSITIPYCSLYCIPLSLIIFILSSFAFLSVLHIATHPSHHPFNLPYMYRSPSSINASPPLCPLMCLSLVKKQRRSQIAQPLTCRCFVFFSLPNKHKHLHVTHTVQGSLQTHTDAQS